MLFEWLTTLYYPVLRMTYFQHILLIQFKKKPFVDVGSNLGHPSRRDCHQKRAMSSTLLDETTVFIPAVFTLELMGRSVMLADTSH